jgi:monooxygenase
VPVRDESVEAAPLMDLDSGYVQRMVHTLPRQGTAAPWALTQSYLHDAVALRRARLDDGVLRWS